MTTVHLPRGVEPADLPDGFLHVVVFGPGHGEAVLVRTPDGRVGIVDGCGGAPDATRRGSPIFGLLDALKVRVPLFACLTHPHRDHLGGFADLITRRPPEHLWWSGRQERRFFSHYVDFLKRNRRNTPVSPVAAPLSDDVQGVADAIRSLADSRPPGSRAQSLENWQQVLDHPLAGRPTLQIHGILPSTAGVREAEEDALRAALGADARASGLDPNRISAALLLTWGVTKVLLGGDALRGSAESHAGWDGLPFSLGKVHAVKVPHHASSGAHSPALWQKMQPDLAIVTCVKHATATQPPRPNMLEGLLATGSRLAITSRPAWWPAPGALQVEPSPWPARAPASAVGNPALAGIATPASAAAEHENAVLVRLDHEGHIVRVQLHGGARELRRPLGPP